MLWLTPWSRVVTVLQLAKKFPAFYGTRHFITVFTWSRHWATSFQPMPSHHRFLRSILLLSLHLHQRLPGGLPSLGFSTKPLYVFVLSPIRATCSAYLILVESITRMIIGESHKSRGSTLCIFIESSLHHLGLNIFLGTVFTDTSACALSSLRGVTSIKYNRPSYSSVYFSL